MTPEQYRYLIAELVSTVSEAGGLMKRMKAERVTARRLGISVTNMQAIAVNARADRALDYDLRTDTLRVPNHADGSRDG